MPRAPRLVPFVLCVLAAAAGCREDAPATPEQEEAQRAWDALQANPTTDAYLAFRVANLMAAREHGEMHDPVGIELQLRMLEAQAGEAERQRAAGHERAPGLAYEVADRVAELERRGLVEVYDETVPGAGERLRGARERALRVVGAK